MLVRGACTSSMALAGEATNITRDFEVKNSDFA
jgi:hypothetical protein